jgi:hypothetical protein
MANPTKFLGSMLVSSWAFSLDTNPTTGKETVTLTDSSATQEWYLSGDDGADDFVKHLEDQINDATVMADTATVSISSTGVISISSSAGSYTITWGVTGAALQAVLRMQGATTNFSTTPATGQTAAADPWAARYFAHADRPTRRDIPADTGRMSMAEADDGTLSGVDAGPIIRRYMAQVRYTGPHRSTVPNGNTEFKDFFATTIKPIRKFRWYPDTTVTTPWADITNPWGYHVVKEKKMREYIPREVIANDYTWYFLDFDMQVQP